MNDKFYVSLEAARLLKEKGYNEVVESYYDTLGELNEVRNIFQNSVADNSFLYRFGDYYAAPTKAEAIDWLESKGIVVELSYDDQAHMDNARWEYFIYTHDNEGWVEAMVCSWHENHYYKTRLQAEGAAIFKALKLLNRKEE
jgi:hypothetical protein